MNTNILDIELRNRKLIVADTQDLLRNQIEQFEGMEKHMSDVYSSERKVKLTLVNEFKRPKFNVRMRFFTGKHKKHRFSEISDVLMRAIRKSKTFSDQERIYQHYKTVDDATDDVEIIPYLDIKEVSTLDEILATVAFLIVNDYQNIDDSVYSHVTKDGQENLNLGYCQLSDENNEEHIYVIFMERFCSEGGDVHYHLHCTIIPRKYKKIDICSIKNSPLFILKYKKSLELCAGGFFSGELFCRLFDSFECNDKCCSSKICI